MGKVGGAFCGMHSTLSRRRWRQETQANRSDNYEEDTYEPNSAAWLTEKKDSD